MKVLWFTPTPSLAEEHLHNKPMNGGFIKSLERDICEKVNLSVAFYHEEQVAPFTINKTTYYPILHKGSHWFNKIKMRLFNEIEPEGDITKFVEIINKVNPDLIHVHGTENPFGLIQRTVSIPSVVSIQGNITVITNKFFSGIPKTDSLRYSSIRKKISLATPVNTYKSYKKLAAREQEIYSLTNYFIGRTAWDNRITRVLSPNSTYFHNDEVLRDTFYSGQWQKKEYGGPLGIFTITGPNIFKGLETVVHCASLLDKNKIHYVWKVAGIEPNDDMIRIIKKSLRIDPSPNLVFIGRAEDAVLKSKLQTADIYVSASHIENSPNSLCEAMILGLPCIATSAGGTPSLLVDKVDGILIQDGDPYAMAGAILELAEDEKKALLYSQNARQKAMNRHSSSKVSNDLLNIYREILDLEQKKNSPAQ